MSKLAPRPTTSDHIRHQGDPQVVRSREAIRRQQWLDWASAINEQPWSPRACGAPYRALRHSAPDGLERSWQAEAVVVHGGMVLGTRVPSGRSMGGRKGNA